MADESQVKRSRVLVVDDDPSVLKLHARVIEREGHEVETVSSGSDALQALSRAEFDVILSDIDMPLMTGIELLDKVREQNLDVPVMLISGTPTLQTAMQAVERGALRYLTKPVSPAELARHINDAARMYRIAKVKRMALNLAGGFEHLVGDQAGLVASFGRALSTLYMAYQPIVSWSKRSIFGYEGLLRTREANLPHPGAVIDAAERLGRMHELGRRIRSTAIEPLDRLPHGALLFLNLHTSDLADPQLLAASGPIAPHAGRIVLEITERASLHDSRDVRNHIGALRKLGFRLAIDDLGAGYAGLTSFALVEPEVVKLDMFLVRDLPKSPVKRTVVSTMFSMCRELGITVISEGVETPEERDALVELGGDLMQGYLFGRPGAPFQEPTF